jgi:hypothetical protein
MLAIPAIMAALFLVLSANSTVLAGAATASAQTANSSRICTRILPTGSTILEGTNVVEFPNGTSIDSSTLPCYISSTDSSTGNIAYAYILISGSGSEVFSHLTSNWWVNRNPTNGQFAVGQDVTFWAGLQGYSSLMQVVLKYGCVVWNIFNQCIEGSNTSWSLFDEYLTGSNDYKSSAVSVSNPDLIKGDVVKTGIVRGCAPYILYTITATDTSTGKSVVMQPCNSISDSFQDAVGGSMEVHSLSTCNQLPPDNYNEFYPISFSISGSGGSLSYYTGSDVAFCSAVAIWEGGNQYIETYWSS